MCFDDQVLSAYYDGELEGVWETKVKEHISSCSICSGKVTSYRKAHDFLHKLQTPDYTFQKNAVLERIHHTISTERELGFWYRKVYLPKTAVMIAAVSLVFIGVSIFLLRPTGFQERGYIAEAAEHRFPGTRTETISSVDMNNVIQFLNSQDEVIEFTIDLPFKHDFKYLGEPKFLKEADFVRGR